MTIDEHIHDKCAGRANKIRNDYTRAVADLRRATSHKTGIPCELFVGLAETDSSLERHKKALEGICDILEYRMAAEMFDCFMEIKRGNDENK